MVGMAAGKGPALSPSGSLGISTAFSHLSGGPLDPQPHHAQPYSFQGHFGAAP